MEFMLDTVNIPDIIDLEDHLPIAGVTSNPSIVKQVKPDDFFSHMRKIRKILGPDRSLHIQLVSTDYEGMLREAKNIVEEVDSNVYIKVPASYIGIKVIKKLKEEDYRVTATAIYDQMQAYMALAAGSDYIAPYVNRIGNLGGDPMDLISNLNCQILEGDYNCKIVAASFKNLDQVKKAIDHGAQAVTVQPDIYRQIFKNPSIEKAIEDFNHDWYLMYDKNLQ